MKIGERIKNRRIELGLSVDEVADKLGKNRATIYRYEKDDIKDLPITVLEPLAKVLETTPADLMGWSNDAKRFAAYAKEFNKSFKNRNDGVKIKVYGRVAAGVPIEMIEDIVDEEEITEDMARRGTYFGLIIKGDSMTPNICSIESRNPLKSLIFTTYVQIMFIQTHFICFQRQQNYISSVYNFQSPEHQLRGKLLQVHFPVLDR